MTAKEQLRKELIHKRKSLPIKKADFQIIKENKHYKNADCVCCYISFGSEIDTRSLIWSIAAEKRLVVPYCTDKCGSMILTSLKSPDELHIGTFSIPEPENPIPIDKKCVDLFIVPGIAFDFAGTRLGFGKGYYDRILKDSEAYKIGLCHRELFLMNLPSEKHDIKVDEVITF